MLFDIVVDDKYFEVLSGAKYQSTAIQNGLFFVACGLELVFSFFRRIDA
jgi:hypothetical protein